MYTSANLTVVATPIGNLADIGQRALDVLANVDIIAVEDTRHSAKLLRAYEINTPMQPLHDHNEQLVVEKFIEQMQAGKTVALISDAGTPLISDPGYHLVRATREAGLTVSPIPGPCAAVAALSVSGFATDKFSFQGFLPAKAGAREKRLQALVHSQETLIFYEAPHRICDCLSAMREVFGAQRQALIARELTKTYETLLSGSLAELEEVVNADPNQQKGEFVVLIAADQMQQQSEQEALARKAYSVLADHLRTKDAVSCAAAIAGVNKNALYQWAIGK